MARIKGAMMTRKRRNKTLKLAKGYYGSKSRLFKTAKQAVMKSGQYAYIGRKQKKRVQKALDYKNFCSLQNERYELLNIHQRS